MEARDRLRERIDAEYRRRGDSCGWRFLSSPPHVLSRADVAFIGLNPGGRIDREDHAEFAMEVGSAYSHESWHGAAVGCAPLQRQVRALFARIGVAPDDVLAGNLVPFRSPSWSALSNRREAISFGSEIWSDVLSAARPGLVIAMGGPARRAIRDILGVTDVERVPLGWGTVAGECGLYEAGRFVGLPHLSRFAVIGRPASEGALHRLFGEHWRDEM